MRKVPRVFTPGSKPPGRGQKGRGRPKKSKDVRKGSTRKGNYRSKYAQSDLEQAIKDIQAKVMSLNAAAKHYRQGWAKFMVYCVLCTIGTVYGMESMVPTLTLPTFDIRVPKATLSNRVNEQVKETLGRPTELTKEEEAILVERLMILGEWGFPMTCRDLRLLIKAYLDVKGKSTRNESNYNTAGTLPT
jgi:hypothetical protein